MPFFPRAFISADNCNTSPSIHPLLRLLDDFESYSPRDENGTGRKSLARTFQPKFDVREVETGYELHGELPGIEQKDVEIEFTDAQTLNIHGKVEREYTSGEKPVQEKPVEETKKTEGHQPTVEDEPEYENIESTPSTPNALEKGKESEKQVQQQQPEKFNAKFWISERSVGSFSRAFTFSQRIDHDNVKANMNNGLLTIFVPKKEAESRRIQIQ